MSARQKKFRVLITGGGTGGHIYPLTAVVVELQTLAAQHAINLDIRYFGAYGAFRPYLEENDVRVSKIADSKFRRYFSPMNLIDIPKFIWSLLQAFWKIYWYMPNVVFSKGGGGSLPVVLAARFYRIPVLIHESDAIPGLNNRLAAKSASLVATSFEGAAQYFTNSNIFYTGNPVRKYLLSDDTTQERAKGFFEFNPQEPLILVLGGSQGAAQINDMVLDTLTEILPFAQILHQTGVKNYKNVLAEFRVVSKDLPENLRSRYRAMDYFKKDLRLALRAADLVISRAGAGSIFEMAAFAKPSILIPLPGSANAHQEANAVAYQTTGAAIIMTPDNLLPNLFVENIRNLLESPLRLEKMSQAAINFYKPEAASNLAQVILKYR
ncbi:MAG: UDP-N-acetylglucosamine--N-acetylmuramyl-(pentapeptide) pyrophosphoryl-undecaprenol N-acetylglucosamine transferase [Candidatus Colwellbacteria bacterium]|nr:UDP-N-acetylglucosamine--N-acetylmuramyl-(pentapeptide) pyrophosphoryl-undecaprenol N-acetylglucosamine transferase [Candidatus Colwellbacteria bacterium]